LGGFAQQEGNGLASVCMGKIAWRDKCRECDEMRFVTYRKESQRTDSFGALGGRMVTRVRLSLASALRT